MPPVYFFGFILSFIGGVLSESIFSFGPTLGIFLGALSLLFLFLKQESIPKYRFLVSLLFFGLALGILRVDVSQYVRKDVLDAFVGKMVTEEGIIIEEPDVREGYTNIVLETRRVLYNENEPVVLDTPSRVLVRAPSYPELYYGDEVHVLGKLLIPQNSNQPQERGGTARAFDYRAYLAKDDIYYQVYFPKISLVEREQGNYVFEKLFALKRWLMGNIVRGIPEPEASLAGGITLGTKQSLGDELLQKFRETGVAHIVVLSGYNIAVVAGIISSIGTFLPFVPRLLVSAIGILLFAMMVGGGATVVRATLMALVIILARILGREGDALRVLVLVGAIMVFVNPMILLSDVSFQLSFSATLALIIFVPVIEPYFSFIPSRVFREIIVTTFATQVFVLPLILYHMGSISLIGLIANIFILPVVPLAMMVVSLVAIGGGVPFLGSAVAYVAYLTLAYIIFAVDFFAHVPFASLSGISFPLGGLVFGYVLLGWFIIKNTSQKNVEEKSAYEF